MNPTDTILAPATAPLPAGVAVIRLSGPQAHTVGHALLPKLTHAAPNTLVYGPLTHNGTHLDDAMAVKFTAPASFTGEDVVEFHTHGGRAVVQAVLEACLTFQGVRMAQAGEFTRRAVENGKLDLTAAEGLADLIAATTEAQRKQALRQLDGALGTRFEHWRNKTLQLLAQVEAGIDFPDEELEILADPALTAGIQTLLSDLQKAAGEQAGERLRDGLRLAIIGKPNAGKSTLLNLLAGRDVAIVSPIAGTTRDVVTSTLDIGGYPVTVADTAGLRETPDIIEAEGVKRAKKQAEQADILIAVVDGHTFPTDAEALAPLFIEGRTLLILSRAEQFELDFPSQFVMASAARPSHATESIPVIATNLTEPQALQRLLPALTKLVQNVAGEATEAALLTRERHKSAVREAMRHLAAALVQITTPREDTSTAELVAEDLRQAAQSIGQVTGRTTSEDVLDVVFSTFCIGK